MYHATFAPGAGTRLLATPIASAMVLAHAYLVTDQVPQFVGWGSSRVNKIRIDRIRREYVRGLGRFKDLYHPDCNEDREFDEFFPVAKALAELQRLGDENKRPGVITECYTQWGSSSAFTSLRGTKGVRNYFSKPNALFLDGVLRTLRKHWRDGKLRRDELFLLLASVIEEVTITANVNGTFHDFNRDRLWPNAEQNFLLRLPIVSHRAPPAEIANADAMIAASCFRSHHVCYLDPPYNFRQYTAYYHLLNFIAAFPFLPDVGEYTAGLTHVRGQHPDDDFTSEFCFRDRFVLTLRSLLGLVNADHVIMSYYSGRNHWNHWSAVTIPTDEGFRELRAVFEDRSLFTSCEVVPALEIRKNYQSRGGERKGLVNEYLFHGVLRKRKRDRIGIATSLSANDTWGLSNEFRHIVPAVKRGVDKVVCVPV